MAVNPLSLADSLRPWHVAGISFFLADSAIDAGALPAAESLPSAEPGLNTAPASSCAPSVSRGASPLPQPQAPCEVSQPVPQAQQVRADAFTAPLPTADWPEPWQALLARTPRAPIVWTYPELGEDLSGQGDKSRAACLRELIGILNLPKGSSAFWPLALPGEQPGSTEERGFTQAEGQDASRTGGTGGGQGFYFRQGLHVLRPSAVIFFGHGGLARSGLSLPMQHAFTQHIERGVLFVLLPQFSSVQSQAEIFSKTSAYLRSALSGIPALFT